MSKKMDKLIEQALQMNVEDIHINVNNKLLNSQEARAHLISVLNKIQTSIINAYAPVSTKRELADDGIHNLPLFKEIHDIETRCKKDYDVANIRYNRCVKKYTLKKKRTETVQSLVAEAYSLYTQFYELWNNEIELMNKYSIVDKDKLTECASILRACISKYNDIIAQIPQGRVASMLASASSEYESMNIIKRQLVSKTAYNRAKFAKIADIKLIELNYVLGIIEKINISETPPMSIPTPTNVSGTRELLVPSTKFEQLLHSTEPEPCLPVAIHDGDTMYVNVLFPLGETDPSKKFPVTLTVRLLGYDCAEIIPKGPSRTKKDKLQEKILGTLGKWAFMQKIGFVSDTDIRKNQMVHVKFEGMDKYGRTLGTVFVNGLNVNQYMLESNFAYSYEGATKECSAYVSAHFDKFYTMIEDGSIRQYVLEDGVAELTKMTTEYGKL